MKATIQDNNGQTEEIQIPDTMPPSRLYREKRVGAINQIAPHNLPDKPLEYIYELIKATGGEALYRYYGARQKA